MTTRRLLLVLALALACKSAKEREEARRAQQIVDDKADLRERLKKRKLARQEKKEWIKSHPEALSDPIDPSQRPTAQPSPVPPQLLGATPAKTDAGR
jgi:hypothetical protein